MKMQDNHDILLETIDRLARAKGIALPPNWQGEVDFSELQGDVADVARVCVAMGWKIPVLQQSRPRPDQLPLLLYDPEEGWALAEQWENEDHLRLAGGADQVRLFSEDLVFFDLEFPDPAQGKRETSARSIFWQAIKRRKSVLVYAAIATVFANLLALVTALYGMQVFDRVIPLASYATLFVLTLGALVALTFDFVLRTVRSIMVEKEAENIDFEVSEYFFARSQALRMEARPPGVGTLAAQLRGIEQVRGVMSSGSLFLLADLPFAVFFLLFIWYVGGPVALVPLISLPIALLLAFVLARLIRNGTDRAQVSGNRKNGLLVESLDAAESVKATSGGWHMLARWNRLVREVHHYEDPIKRTSAVAQSVFNIIQQVSYIGIMAVGAFEVGEGNMTTGALLACSIIGGRVNGPLIAQLPGLIVQSGYAKSSLKALDAIMQLPVERDSVDTALRPDTLKGPLLVDGLRFLYPGARETLEIPNLAIPDGQRVAIVGGVGSGKTTLLRVLSGLYHPQAGNVKLGGLDMSQIANDLLRRHIGYLPQDYRLINGTLRDNLTLGIGRLDDEVLLAAAEKTGLDQTIGAHPLGLDLPIQEGGRGLSGGQRTLVGLTRLVLINPKVWLLDEPTANLDAHSEGRFMNLLAEELTGDRTLIVVTHRLSLLRHFQRVLVMARGRVTVDGPRDEVLKRLQTPAPKTNTVVAQPLGRTTS